MQDGVTDFGIGEPGGNREYPANAGVGVPIPRPDVQNRRWLVRRLDWNPQLDLAKPVGVEDRPAVQALEYTERPFDQDQQYFLTGSHGTVVRQEGRPRGRGHDAMWDLPKRSQFRAQPDPWDGPPVGQPVAS